MAEDEKPPSLKEFDARLQRLQNRDSSEAPGNDGQANASPRFGDGIQVGIELVAGVGFGVLVGYGLDGWLGTKPWCIVIGFFIGTAAGMSNAYRRLKRMGGEDGSGR